MVKVVAAPGASVVAPKPTARLNPVGRAIAPSVRLEVPALRTVKVWVSGVPGAGAPKVTWPVASGTAVGPAGGAVAHGGLGPRGRGRAADPLDPHGVGDQVAVGQVAEPDREAAAEDGIRTRPVLPR